MNRSESHIIDRIDRRGPSKDRRAARQAVHKAQAAAEVAGLVEGLTDPEDRRMAVEALIEALTRQHGEDNGKASSVAFLGFLAVQEGAGIKGPKSRPKIDFAKRVADEAGRVEG